MKKKIRREFILVALFTITLTTLLVTAVFYEFFKKEVMDELDIDIQVLQETGVFEMEDIETGLREMPLDDLRMVLSFMIMMRMWEILVITETVRKCRRLYGVEKDSPSDVQIPWMRAPFIMQSGRRMEPFFV